MIKKRNIMKCEKEFSKNERYAIEWFKKNGFEIINIKQYISKTKFTILKNEEEDIFELLSEVSDIQKYMKLFENNFGLKLKIKQMTIK